MRVCFAMNADCVLVSGGFFARPIINLGADLVSGGSVRSCERERPCPCPQQRQPWCIQEEQPCAESGERMWESAPAAAADRKTHPSKGWAHSLEEPPCSSRAAAAVAPPLQANLGHLMPLRDTAALQARPLLEHFWNAI